MTSLAPEPTLADQATAWGRANDISARSALVTILGDTIAPLGGAAWLADVFALAEPFGFSERLIRTSMFRLAAEGWVVSERHGRRSRYALTDHGREETRVAEGRIYRPEVRTWDGSWTLVFLGPNPDDELVKHLRWRGFAPMAEGVNAHPNDSVAETRQLLDRLGIAPAPPIAAARFDGDGEAPIVGPDFRDASGLADAETAYRRFLDRYESQPIDGSTLVDRAAAGDLTPVDAFTLRTMVVHDLRRARLRDPDLPDALLPSDWVGHRAVELGATLYRNIDDAAWRWVEQITGSTVVDDALVAARFAARARTEPTSPSAPTEPDTTKGSP